MSHIVKKSKTPEGYSVILEDWSKEYPSVYTGATKVGIYPIAAKTTGGTFGPKKGEPFRCELDFDTEEEALEAYRSLEKGTTKAADYKEHVLKQEYREAL